MWISVSERVPAVGREVFVKGKYVAPGTGNPRARWCDCRWVWKHPHFESREWRGMVGITHWWEEEMKPYVEQAIRSNAVRIGQVAAEDAGERAERQLATLRALNDYADEELRRALEDMPADAATGLEIFFILMEEGS